MADNNGDSLEDTPPVDEEVGLLTGMSANQHLLATVSALSL